MEKGYRINLEWIDSAIHTYVEEVRAAALFLLSNVPEEKRERKATMIISTIRENIDAIDDFMYDRNIEYEQGVLSFPAINEEEIKSCYRRDITDLCLYYKRCLKKIIKTSSSQECLEHMPVISSSVLRTIEELQCIE